MTISELLGKSTDELEALSLEELREHLREHFVYSRPDPSRKTQGVPKEQKKPIKTVSAQEQAKQLLENMFGYKV